MPLLIVLVFLMSLVVGYVKSDVFVFGVPFVLAFSIFCSLLIVLLSAIEAKRFLDK